MQNSTPRKQFIKNSKTESVSKIKISKVLGTAVLKTTTFMINDKIDGIY